MKHHQKGFTLVEIAIVLVIIGLLLGGILKGQEMIVQAKIKNVVADMTGVSAAMYGYQDRYRALPGDDKNAGGRWATSGSGNGDGVIGGLYSAALAGSLTAPTLPGDESPLFWHHLRLAGFVAGTGSDQPFNAVSGKMGVQSGDGATGGVLGPTPFAALILCSANLPDKIAISVDAQTDDGVGTTGSVRALKQTSPNQALGTGAASNATAYTEDGVSTYLVCRTML